METKVSATLFARNMQAVSEFYSGALGLVRARGDEYHSVLNCGAFELIVHQMTDCPTGKGLSPSRRRSEANIRLDFPVRSVAESRRLATSLGGEIDNAPPPWGETGANVFLGHDPEGNVFKISEVPAKTGD